MKATKRVIKIRSFYDRTGIESELTQMAEKGWLIDNISGLGWVYRKIEPKKLSFCITYYPRFSVLSSEITEEQKTFYEFCERSGWKLAAANHQMHIFYNEQVDAVPIETDPVLEVENIHDSAKKNLIRYKLVFIALSLVMILNSTLRILSNPIEFFSDVLYTTLTFEYIILLIFILHGMCRYYSWRSKAKKAALRGEFLETTGHGILQKILVLATIIAIILSLTLTSILSAFSIYTFILILTLLEILALFFIGWTVLKRLKRKNKSVSAIRRFLIMYTVLSIIGSLIISMIGTAAYDIATENNNWYTGYTFDGNKPPLVMEDFTNINPSAYTTTTSGSETLLLGYFKLQQESKSAIESIYKSPILEYTVTSVNAPFMYSMCKEHLLGARNYIRTQDTALWGAQEVYLSLAQDESYDNIYTYLLLYENHIVEISYNGVLTPEQISIITEKLGNM